MIVFTLLRPGTKYYSTNHGEIVIWHYNAVSRASQRAATAEQHFAFALRQKWGTAAALVIAVAQKNGGSVRRAMVLQVSLGDTNIHAQVLHRAGRFGLAGCSDSVIVCSAVGCFSFLADLATYFSLHMLGHTHAHGDLIDNPKHNQVRATLV